jgi:hypothetical protein
MPVTIIFHKGLKGLVSIPLADDGSVVLDSGRMASVKDVIEALGVPHTEIGRIEANGKEVSFGYTVNAQDRLDVYAIDAPVDFSTPSILRPEPLEDIRFLVDVNVGRLAILLRMVGMDTAYKNSLSDAELAEMSSIEKRILLTRDTRLLRRSKVVFGHLVRETAPLRQLAEVVRLFNLSGRLSPFTRCLVCNSVLEPIEKDRIIHRLEPLTKQYYDTFYLCPGCGKIYWPGSHKIKMEEMLRSIRTIW